jgi:hypothetical protein
MSNKPEIRITISGPAGCGKSTVAEYIRRKLAELLSVSIADPVDIEDLPGKSYGAIYGRLESLAASTAPRVVIETRTTKQGQQPVKGAQRPCPSGCALVFDGRDWVGHDLACPENKSNAFEGVPPEVVKALESFTDELWRQTAEWVDGLWRAQSSDCLRKGSD